MRPLSAQAWLSWGAGGGLHEPGEMGASRNLSRTDQDDSSGKLEDTETMAKDLRRLLVGSKHRSPLIRMGAEGGSSEFVMFSLILARY